MSVSRRDFLKTAALGAAACVAAPVLAQEKALSKSEVFVGKGKAMVAIAKIVDKMGGMGQFVKPGSRVLIKPNMSFACEPARASNTSPEAVAAVVALCVKAGAKRVIVCDYTLADAAMCKDKSGIAATIKDIKEAVVYTPNQEAQFEEKSHESAKELIRTKLVKELGKVDSFICLPTLKSHSATGVSLGIKGLMGLVWDRGTFHRDLDLHKAVAEQLYYMKPTLTIIDGSRALLDNGPGGPGKVIELNTFVAGLDPVATDSFAVTLASWYGRTFEGKSVKHLAHAASLGFGNVESGAIREIVV